MRTRQVKRSTRRRTALGSAMIEFVLATIPTLLCLISILEISRIMYTYDSMANAARMTARYAVVHGADCSLGSNSCSATIGNIAQQFVNANPGLPASAISLTLTSQSGSTTCTLSTCLTNTTPWPSGTAATPGNTITVAASAPMKTSLMMFVPGAGSVQFNQPTVRASSRQVIQF